MIGRSGIPVHFTVDSPPRWHVTLTEGEAAADTAALKKVRLRVRGRTVRAVMTHIVLLMATHFPGFMTMASSP
jgi:hypothetical protein